MRQHRELDARNFDELSLLTCEIINRARGEIVAVSKSPRLPQLSSFWAVLTDRIDNHGVAYHRIADLDEVEAHGLNIVRRDMDVHHIDLNILERDAIEHEFYVVDGKYAAIKHRDGKAYQGVGRVTNYLDVVDRYSKRFQKYLAKSIPGSFVVEGSTEPRKISWNERLGKCRQRGFRGSRTLWTSGNFQSFTK